MFFLVHSNQICDLNPEWQCIIRICYLLDDFAIEGAVENFFYEYVLC